MIVCGFQNGSLLSFVVFALIPTENIWVIVMLVMAKTVLELTIMTTEMHPLNLYSLIKVFPIELMMSILMLAKNATVVPFQQQSFQS
jgi:hypothetical protein